MLYFKFDLIEQGYTDEDLEIIDLHFSFTVTEDDYDLITLFKNEPEILAYLDLLNKEGDPKELIQDHEFVIQLNHGKWAIYDEELDRKDTLAQMD
ncbi:hypothetical protein [Jeotgalibacillus proteolyticus]|uniref:Uncharacterized protein n=1 Tax=Jeotgalibacillus proteolyticus TaxID=2082395 RepID=A0A2S5GFI9_9BACL|nr:hypothetical protein [Jeotgalibacillus proteolyticus]PPA71807.1 hypothetical protein C4B60_00045 [Jeotgalibacillus proteolyticus]